MSTSPVRSRLPRVSGIPSFEALERRALLASGDFDPTFDGDGILLSTPGGADSVAYDVAVQPNGKIIVAGDQGLVRFNVDGSNDESFGTNGVILGSFNTVAVAPDGRIMALTDNKSVLSDLGDKGFGFGIRAIPRQRHAGFHLQQRR